MTQTQLLQGFRQLSLSEQLEMIQAALRIIAQQMQAVEQGGNDTGQQSQLAIAAQQLVVDYTDDDELTNFSVLDGEPIYAQK